uniref:Uncharacterized protein n=1 Tax=Rhizophora mucronata TaxID=61149 RepID=A0A2P2PBD7_RHIMU
MFSTNSKAYFQLIAAKLHFQ